MLLARSETEMLTKDISVALLNEMTLVMMGGIVMGDLKERLAKMDQTPMTREEMLESLIENGYVHSLKQNANE